MYLRLIFLFTIFFIASCSEPNQSKNTNPTTVNSNVLTNSGQKDLPQGISVQPTELDKNNLPQGINPSAEKIPANVNAGPTPGIPNEETLSKPMPKGKPTPGIPNEETLKKQLSNTSNQIPDEVNNPKK